LSELEQEGEKTVRIKVYVVDVRLPRWLRRPFVFGAVLFLILGLGAIVYASAVNGQPDFTAGDVLTAAGLNARMGALQNQINAINSTTVNGHALTGNVAVAYADISPGALANGTTATTQPTGDNSTRIATTAYVDNGSYKVLGNPRTTTYNMSVSDVGSFILFGGGVSTVNLPDSATISPGMRLHFASQTSPVTLHSLGSDTFFRYGTGGDGTANGQLTALALNIWTVYEFFYYGGGIWICFIVS
jgi:hypothetical protein